MNIAKLYHHNQVVLNVLSTYNAGGDQRYPVARGIRNINCVEIVLFMVLHLPVIIPTFYDDEVNDVVVRKISLQNKYEFC